MTKEEEKGNKEELQQQQQLTFVRRVRIMIDHDKKKKKRGQSIEEKSFYDLQKTIKQHHIVANFPGGKGVHGNMTYQHRQSWGSVALLVFNLCVHKSMIICLPHHQLVSEEIMTMTRMPCSRKRINTLDGTKKTILTTHMLNSLYHIALYCTVLFCIWC